MDAGVLIAILDRDDAHHLAAREAVASALGVDELVLPASAYAEILVLPYRIGPEAVCRADAFVDDLPARIEPSSREIASAAAGLRAQHGRSLKLADALVIATARVIGANRVLTTDRRWPAVGVPIDIVGAGV